MKEKKNIDNLFEERFQNFEAAPSPRVWENIQVQLKKEKKDRKVIPLWIKLGGVAALLALLLTVGNAVFNSSEVISPSVSDENVQQNEKKLDGDKPFSATKNIDETKVVSEGENPVNDKSQSEDDLKNFSEKNINSHNSLLKKKSNEAKVAVENSENTSAEKERASKQSLIKESTSEENKNGERITSNISSEKEKSKSGKKENLIKTEADISKVKKEGVAVNENYEKDVEKTSVQTEEEIKTESGKNKKSILDAIAEQNEAKEKAPKKQKPENRWEVAPNVAPVYYSSLKNGSSLDPAFADNSQSGDVNVSYGVQVSYALSDRLSLRSGVSNVDLSYSTAGIEIGTGPVAQALRSVDYGGKSIVVTAVDKGTFASGATSGGFGDIIPKSTGGNAKIIQNINYYEVPLELKYSVINNKFGVNVIGGLSTLFLGNNEISVKADNFKTVLGEANNLSSISFSTNVGLGLDYKLSKKFTFNIEPMFKYQLNPYTDSSVNFKPYYLGVYSGLSFKF